MTQLESPELSFPVYQHHRYEQPASPMIGKWTDTEQIGDVQRGRACFRSAPPELLPQ